MKNVLADETTSSMHEQSDQPDDDQIDSDDVFSKRGMRRMSMPAMRETRGARLTVRFMAAVSKSGRDREISIRRA